MTRNRILQLEQLLERLEAEEEAGRLAGPEAASAALQIKRRRAYEKRIQKQYGMTLADYRALHRIQGGCCAICGIEQERLSVDHCHETERVRGLLCSRCNIALGLLRESLVSARALLLYVERRCIPAKQAGSLYAMVSPVTKNDV